MTYKLTLRPNSLEFSDLPWDSHLTEWEAQTDRLVKVQSGLSRHPVVFVSYDGDIYAVKELPAGVAGQEYKLLRKLEEMHLPAVAGVGYANIESPDGPRSALITRFLDHSLSYHSLVLRTGLQPKELSLLDSMAGLLVQLHLAGIFWGDCSLSNTLFRHDAGALQAYLVDAETAEIHSPRLTPTLRYHELEIMEENVRSEIVALANQDLIEPVAFQGLPVTDTGHYVRQRYLALWEEITREVLISPGEHYRIQERIATLNDMGYSVKQVELLPSAKGDKLRLRVIVADRSFHRNQMFNLTGIEAEERQATKMLNEITELQGYFTWVNHRIMPITAAAYYWLDHVYLPTLDVLRPAIQRLQESGETVVDSEMYLQVLEHKWYLSEQAQHDVGHKAAAEDFIKRFANPQVK